LNTEDQENTVGGDHQHTTEGQESTVGGDHQDNTKGQKNNGNPEKVDDPEMTTGSQEGDDNQVPKKYRLAGKKPAEKLYGRDPDRLTEAATEATREATEMKKKFRLTGKQAEENLFKKRRVFCAFHAADPNCELSELLKNDKAFDGECWGCGHVTDHIFCQACVEELKGPDRDTEAKADHVEDSLHGNLATRYRLVKENVPCEDTVREILGRQAAYVTKVVDNAEVMTEAGAKPTLKEYCRLTETVLRDPVEIENIPANANVVKGKLLISVKRLEKEEDRVTKARLVAMGNVIFDKQLYVIKNAPAQDLWAPVCSMTGFRYVEARAAAHKRRSQGLDLVAASTQVLLCGDVPWYLIMP